MQNHFDFFFIRCEIKHEYGIKSSEFNNERHLIESYEDTFNGLSLSRLSLSVFKIIAYLFYMQQSRIDWYKIGKYSVETMPEFYCAKIKRILRQKVI